jgi:DNA-binding MarR family transcriptional regulator
VNVVAHIGNVPVEEWVPFLVPVIGLYLWGRRSERRRRDAVGRLPGGDEPLDETTMQRVEAEWARGKHDGVSREHVALLYPPGPDSLSATELAERVHSDATTVERLLEELEELDYLTMDEGEGRQNRVVSLTFKGFELVDATEVALLSALDDAREEAGHGLGSSASRWPRPSRLRGSSSRLYTSASS